ncbi:MAG TPA: hypothetical protein VN030_11520 [Cellvibrio sp.]|nr:hypothetical protein [Cellvibrio sp.]
MSKNGISPDLISLLHKLRSGGFDSEYNDYLAQQEEERRAQEVAAQQVQPAQDQSENSFIGNAMRGAGERAMNLGAGFVDAIGAAARNMPSGVVGAPSYAPAAPNLTAEQQEDSQKAIHADAESLRNTDLNYDEKRNTLDGSKDKFAKGDWLGAAAELLAAGADSTITSLPDMAAAVSPATVAPYVLATTGDMANKRAENDKREIASSDDILRAAPFAAASAALERILPSRIMRGGKPLSNEEAKDIIDGGLKYAAGKIAKETGADAAIEGGTEFIQSGVLEYVGERYGTQTQMDVAEALKQGAEAAILGAVGGGMLGTGKGAVQSVSDIRSAGKLNREELLDDGEVDLPTNGERVGIIDDLPPAQAASSAESLNESLQPIANAQPATGQAQAPVADFKRLRARLDARKAEREAAALREAELEIASEDPLIHAGDPSNPDDRFKFELNQSPHFRKLRAGLDARKAEREAAALAVQQNIQPAGESLDVAAPLQIEHRPQRMINMPDGTTAWESDLSELRSQAAADRHPARANISNSLESSTDTAIPLQIGHNPQRMIAMPDGTTAWESELPALKKQVVASQHPAFPRSHNLPEQLPASNPADNARKSRMPENMKDTRLLRSRYRDHLANINSALESNIKGQATPKYVSELKDMGSPAAIKAAIGKALSGQKLGENQVRIVQEVLDNTNSHTRNNSAIQGKWETRAKAMLSNRGNKQLDAWRNRDEHDQDVTTHEAALTEIMDDAIQQYGIAPDKVKAAYQKYQSQYPSMNQFVVAMKSWVSASKPDSSEHLNHERESELPGRSSGELGAIEPQPGLSPTSQEGQARPAPARAEKSAPGERGSDSQGRDAGLQQPIDPGWETSLIKARRAAKLLAIPNYNKMKLAELAPAISAKVNTPKAAEKPNSIEGRDIDGDWAEFSDKSGTLNIPRAEMPQIKAEHRGAMVNFLNARDIAHEEETVPATSLKPTQKEFSRAKVAKTKGFEGGSRSILVSSDNHVLDGHHQWMASRDKGEDVKVIRLKAPIKKLLAAAHEFPSSTTEDLTETDKTAAIDASADSNLEDDAASSDSDKPSANQKINKSQSKRNPILTKPKKTYIAEMVTEYGLEKDSPNYEDALEKIEDEYSESLDRAYAELPFEEYNKLNSKSSESVNRQVYDALREDFGLDEKSDDSLYSLGDDSDIITSGVSGSVSQHDADEVIVRIRAGLVDKSVQIKAVRDFSEFPAAVKRHAEKQGHDGSDVKGVFHDGSIYLNRSAIDDAADVERVVLHELYGHYGLRTLFGKEIRSAMTRLYLTVGGSRAIREIAAKNGHNLDKYEEALKDTPREIYTAIMAEELLAHIAQDNKPGVKRFLKELIGALRNWLRAKGFLQLSAVSESELYHVLKLARKAAINGEGRNKVDGTMFSLAANQKPESPRKFSIFKRKDIDPEQAKALREMSPITRQAFDRLGSGNKKWYEKVSSEVKRQLAPGGHLPKDIFDLKIKRDGAMNAEDSEQNFILQAFYDRVQEVYGKPYAQLKQATKKEINDYLRGDRDKVKLTDLMIKTLGELRGHIQRLSYAYIDELNKDIATLEAQGKTAEAESQKRLVETITENIDTYLHRSYRAFDDPKWPDKVRKNHPDVYKNAVDYLAKQYAGTDPVTDKHIARATQKVDLILHEGTAFDSIGKFISESKLGAKDLSALKKRKAIAPEIRALLGEYEDAALNYAKSASKMTRLVHNTAFLRSMRDLSLEMGYIFEEGSRPAGANKKIAADASEVYAPLNGLYTYPEFEQAMRDAVGSNKDPEWYNIIVAANGMVKYGKTVLSPTTAVRNILSGSSFLLTSGHWDLSHTAKSVRAMKTYFSNKDYKNTRAYIKDLLELGVLYDSPNYRELQDLIKSVNESDSKIANILRDSKVSKVMDFAQQFYAMGDDFWKIIGFENEKASLIKHYGMNEAEAKKEAAERIRNTYPTYSMTGKGIQTLRRFPVIASFPSFTAEIIRTSFHKFRYFFKDAKALGYQNPMVFAKGAGLAVASGMMTGIAAMSAAFLGVDDDEEEAIRTMLPEWSRNSTLFFLGRDEKGQVEYMDLGWLDPYGYWKKPLVALARGGNTEDKIADAVWETLSPFLGLDIATASAIKFYDDMKDSNVTAETAWDRLRKGLQPGFANNIEGFWEASQGTITKSGKKFDVGDEAWALLGFRKSTLNTRVALTYQAYGYTDARRNASATLRETATDLGKVSVEDLRGAYNDAMEIQRDAWDEMRRSVKLAMKSGIDKDAAVEALTLSGISKSEAQQIVADKDLVYKPSTNMMKLAIKRAAILLDKEAQQNLIERKKLLNEIIKSQEAQR